MLVLQGPLEQLPRRLRDLGCLPLAQREMRLGVSKWGWLPIGILAVAMSAPAMGFVPVAVAFFAAAGLIMVTGVRPCARRTTMSNGQS